MSNPTKRVKKVKRYTLAEIKSAIKKIYKEDSHLDSWNVPVIYENTFLRRVYPSLTNLTKRKKI